MSGISVKCLFGIWNLEYDLEQTCHVMNIPTDWVSSRCLGVFWDNIKTNRLTKTKIYSQCVQISDFLQIANKLLKLPIGCNLSNGEKMLLDLNMAQLPVQSGGPGETAPR